jgi:hypothetical protein
MTLKVKLLLMKMLKKKRFEMQELLSLNKLHSCNDYDGVKVIDDKRIKSYPGTKAWLIEIP